MIKYLFILFYLFLSPKISGQKTFQYPNPEKSTVVDNYFGTEVADPYRWMEEINSQKTLNWLNDEEGVFTQYKKNLFVEKVYNKLLSYSHIYYQSIVKKGTYYFSYMYNYSGEAPCLYYKKKLDGNMKIIINPDDFKKNKNEVITLKEFSVSSDNKYLSFALSCNGTDMCSIRVKDIESDKILPDIIENVKFSKIAWKGNGFFYYKFDPVKLSEKITAVSKHPKIYYHPLGANPGKDWLIYETPPALGDYVDFNVSSDARYLIVSSTTKVDLVSYRTMLYANLDSFPRFQLKPFLRQPNSKSNIFEFIDNIENKFLILTDLGSPAKRLVVFDPSTEINKGDEIIGPYQDILMQASVSKDKIICLYYLNGMYKAGIFDLNGKIIDMVPFPIGCNVTGFYTGKYDDETFCFLNSFYYPCMVFRLDLKKLTLDALDKTYITFDYSKYETKYVTYKTNDTLEIPMYITYKKGLKRKGDNPTLLVGYGGFGITMSPFFDPGSIIWMENGGILAVPSIRGGGEQGTTWHDEGKGLKKYNGFHDFINAAKFLIDSGYTNPDKLAIEGGSNGGLLVGVAMTQKPELFKAAVPTVGVMDMIRYQNFTVGSYYRQEYGISTNKTDFENLFSYSPLHNIKQGVRYPATLAITSDNDDRVPPLHTYKYIATLQEKGDNTVPYMLLLNKNAGHNGADILNQKLQTEAIKLAFLFGILKVKKYSFADPIR